MRLYLVQHAQAKPKEEDPARPLSEKGREDIRKVAGFLKGYGKANIREIKHSGKTRAEQTAQELAKALSPPEGISQADGLEPLAATKVWVKRIASIAKSQDIMLVGHLPHLSRLASHLICKDEEQNVVRFCQGGIVCLERDEAENWSLGWMIIPELL